MIVYSICVLMCIIFARADESFMSTPQILKNRNIPYEQHQVTTDDGYILSIFRLLKKERKGVVVLQHALSLDSSIYLVSRKRSIGNYRTYSAMEIFNSGYELWLPNFRGLPFSDRHLTLNAESLQYWNFSFHEIGYYDYPAILNHVTNVTNSKVIVINHSMSSTGSLVYASLRPEEAERNVKLFVNLATSSFMNHTRSALRYFTGLYLNVLKPLTDYLELGNIGHTFRPFIQLYKRLVFFLLPTNLIQSVTQLVMEFIAGKSEMSVDPEEYPMILSVSTQAMGTKILAHYCQLIDTGRFCMFNYGLKQNKRRYNATEPPDYPLSNIRVPIYLVFSEGDFMCDAWGNRLLYEKLPPAAKIYGKMELKSLNHDDFIIGKNRFQYFEKILQLLKSIKYKAKMEKTL